MPALSVSEDLLRFRMGGRVFSLLYRGGWANRHGLSACGRDFWSWQDHWVASLGSCAGRNLYRPPCRPSKVHTKGGALGWVVVPASLRPDQGSSPSSSRRGVGLEIWRSRAEGFEMDIELSRRSNCTTTWTHYWLWNGIKCSECGDRMLSLELEDGKSFDCTRPLFGYEVT